MHKGDKARSYINSYRKIMEKILERSKRFSPPASIEELPIWHPAFTLGIKQEKDGW
jgi:hypothetical protein